MQIARIVYHNRKENESTDGPLAVDSSESDVVQKTIGFLPHDDEQIASSVAECHSMTDSALWSTYTAHSSITYLC